MVARFAHSPFGLRECFVMTYSRCDFAENHDSIVTNSHVRPFRSVHLMDRQHEKGPDRMNTIGTFRDIMRVL